MLLDWWVLQLASGSGQRSVCVCVCRVPCLHDRQGQQGREVETSLPPLACAPMVCLRWPARLRACRPRMRVLGCRFVDTGCCVVSLLVGGLKRQASSGRSLQPNSCSGSGMWAVTQPNPESLCRPVSQSLAAARPPKRHPTRRRPKGTGHGPSQPAAGCKVQAAGRCRIFPLGPNHARIVRGSSSKLPGVNPWGQQTCCPRWPQSCDRDPCQRRFPVVPRLQPRGPEGRPPPRPTIRIQVPDLLFCRFFPICAKIEISRGKLAIT